jgi:hypothetical protein
MALMFSRALHSWKRLVKVLTGGKAAKNVASTLPDRDAELNNPRSSAAVKDDCGVFANPFPTSVITVYNAEPPPSRPESSNINEQCRCWIKALKQLKEEAPEGYTQLEAMKFDASNLASMIGTRVEGYEYKAKSTASSQWFRRLKRFLPAIGTLKGFSMAVSRADPHLVAPYICAAIFCAIELALNIMNPDDVLQILEIASDSIIILQKWLLFKAHTTTFGNPATQSITDELFEELPKLYGQTLRLLLSVNSHLNGLRLKKAVDRVSQIDVQWKAMFEGIKQKNKKCDAIRSQAEFLVKAQKDAEAVLNWISTRASEESHSQIMEKTGVSDRYGERGAWLCQIEQVNGMLVNGVRLR